jgi:peptidyl-prolyl isomerase H (cyclophilin H)
MNNGYLPQNPTYTKSLFLKLLDTKNPIIFLDICFIDILKSSHNTCDLENKSVYRIYFELFMHILPKTCENFRQFCTGEYLVNNKMLGYKNTIFTRLINNMFVQGGDFINFDGTGETSIYNNEIFEDEGFFFNHSQIGFLSMANRGKNTNGCQFFITLGECLENDNENVIFGRAIDEYSILILQKINDIKSDFFTETPLSPISIVNCGQM